MFVCSSCSFALQAIATDLVDAMLQCVRSFPRITTSDAVRRMPVLGTTGIGAAVGKPNEPSRGVGLPVQGQQQQQVQHALKGLDLASLLVAYKPLMRARCDRACVTPLARYSAELSR